MATDAIRLLPPARPALARPPIWTCLPAHDLSGLHGKVLRRWAGAVCRSECSFARERYGRANPMWDRYADPLAPTFYRLPHEDAAGTALAWLAELDAHEHLMRATAEQTRPPASLEYVQKLRVRWFCLARGFLRAVSAYRRERAAVDARRVA